MKRASCPSCGAEVVFRSSASILAVCEFCRSTLLRRDLNLENLGRMADLLEDASPVQLGTEGKFKEHRFTVLGRIQYRHSAGIWNEWYILFDDGAAAWLGETPGLCAVTFLVPALRAVPAFAALRVGGKLDLGGRYFTVVNLERPRCIAGEGELPFTVGAGYDTAVADLRGQGNAFATLDYSESPPLLFVGEQLEFAALALTNTRQPDDRLKTVDSVSFQCRNCGAALSPKLAASLVIVCASCGSAHQIDDPKHPILFQEALDQGPQPLLGLGAQGELRGHRYEVVGFLQRESRNEGMSYRWSEYLLAEAAGGFAWLSEYAGHWNFISPATHQPALFRKLGQDRAQYQDIQFRHFQTSEARVSWVLGEFYWQVAVGESVTVREFIAPPLLLAEERTAQELLYSLAEYLDRSEIEAAFKLTEPLPEPTGVYANQPSPWQGNLSGLWRRFGYFALALLAVHLVMSGFDRRRNVAPMNLLFDEALADSTRTTPEFVLTKSPRPVEAIADLKPAAASLGAKIELVDSVRGTALPGAREIANFMLERGSTAAARRVVVRFPEVPAGNYYLAITPTGINAARDQPLSVVVKITREKAGWGIFVLGLMALAAWPLIANWRHGAFETRRWMESGVAPDSPGLPGFFTDDSAYSQAANRNGRSA